MYDVTNTLFYRKPDCPCKGCYDRSVECHGTCEKYAEWSKEEKAINDFMVIFNYFRWLIYGFCDWLCPWRKRRL